MRFIKPSCNNSFRSCAFVYVACRTSILYLCLCFGLCGSNIRTQNQIVSLNSTKVLLRKGTGFQRSESSSLEIQQQQASSVANSNSKQKRSSDKEQYVLEMNGDDDTMHLVHSYPQEGSGEHFNIHISKPSEHVAREDEITYSGFLDNDVARKFGDSGPTVRNYRQKSESSNKKRNSFAINKDSSITNKFDNNTESLILTYRQNNNTAVLQTEKDSASDTEYDNADSNSEIIASSKFHMMNSDGNAYDEIEANVEKSGDKSHESHVIQNIPSDYNVPDESEYDLLLDIDRHAKKQHYSLEQERRIRQSENTINYTSLQRHEQQDKFVIRVGEESAKQKNKPGTIVVPKENAETSIASQVKTRLHLDPKMASDVYKLVMHVASSSHPLQWTEWGVWSVCSVTCGVHGVRQRVRYCVTRKRDICPGLATDTLTCTAPHNCTDELQASDTTSVPVLVSFPVWAQWTQWTGCSSTCGVGMQQRVRLCVSDPLTSHNDSLEEAECVGMRDETRRCHERPCSDVENAMFKLNTAVPGQVFAKLLCTSLTSSSPHPNIYWIAPHGIKIADSLPDARFHAVGKHLYILDKKLMPSNVNAFKCIINGAYGSVQDVDTTMAKELATQCDADNPCVNGGQCVEVAEWYNKPYPHRICVCQWYYRGSHCERTVIRVDAIVSGICVVLCVITGVILLVYLYHVLWRVRQQGKLPVPSSRSQGSIRSLTSLTRRPHNPPLLGVRSLLETAEAKARRNRPGGEQRLSRAFGRHSLVEPPPPPRLSIAGQEKGAFLPIESTSAASTVTDSLPSCRLPNTSEVAAASDTMSSCNRSPAYSSLSQKQTIGQATLTHISSGPTTRLAPPPPLLQQCCSQGQGHQRHHSMPHQQQQQRVNATRNASFSRERDTDALGVRGQLRDSANFEACRRQFPEQATSKLRTDSDSSCIVQGLSTQRCGSGQQQKMLSTTTQQQSPADNSVSQQQSSQQWENLQRTYQKHGMLPRQESPRDCSHVRDFQPIRDRNNSSSYHERQRTDDCHSLVASSEVSATDQSDVTTSRHVTSDTSDTSETLYKVNTNANNRALSTHSDEASEITNKFLSLQSLDNDYAIKQTEVDSGRNVTSPPGKVKDAPLVSRLHLDEVDSETTGDEMMDGRNTEGEEDAASSISHDVILNVTSDDASERSIVKPPSLNSSQPISSSNEESVDIVEKCVIKMTSSTSLSSCSECDTVRDKSQVTSSQVDSSTDECQVTGSDTDAGDPLVVQQKLMTRDVNDVTVPSKPSSRLLPESLMSPSAILTLLASSRTQCPPVSSLAPVTPLESPVTPVSDKLHSQSQSSQPVQQQRRQSVIRRLSVTGVTGRQGSEVKAVPPFMEEVVRLANTISHQPLSLPPPSPGPSIAVSVATKPVNNSAASAGLSVRDTRTVHALTSCSNEADHMPLTQQAQRDQSSRPGDTPPTNEGQGHVADAVRTHQPPPTLPHVVRRRSVLDRLTVTDNGQDGVVPCDDTTQAAGKLGEQQDEDGRSDIASQIIQQKMQAQGFSSVMSRFRASPLPSMTLNLSHPVAVPTNFKDILRSKHLQDDPLTFMSCQRTFADSLRGGVAAGNDVTGQGQTVIGALSRDVRHLMTSSTPLPHQPVAPKTMPTKPQPLSPVKITCQQLNTNSHTVSATVDIRSVSSALRSCSEERCVAPLYSQPMKVPSTSNINNNSSFTRQEFSIISGGPDTGIAAANQRTAAKLTGLTTKLSKLFPIEAEFEDNCSVATSVWEASSVGSVYSRGDGGDLGGEDEDIDSALPVTCPPLSVTHNTHSFSDQVTGSSSSKMSTTLPVISRQTPPPLAASSRADTSVDRLTTINNVCERFMKVTSSSRPASAVTTGSTGSQTNTVGCRHGDSVIEDGDTLSEDDEVDRWVRDNLRGQGHTAGKMSRDAAADLMVAFDERLAQVCPDNDLDLVPVAASVSRHLRSQNLRHLVHSASPLTRSLIHASSDNSYSPASFDL